MKFNVTIVDPPDFKFAHFLFDQARYLLHGLESLGHDACITRGSVDPSRMNVLINAHALKNPETVRAIVQSRAPYVVVQTENLSLTDGVNHALGEEHWRRCFLPLIQGAHGIWDFSKENLDVLTQVGVPADVLDWGYHPCLEEIRHKRTRDIDLLWYGSVTPHRHELLTAMAKRGFQVHAVFDPVALYRNDLIARSRIVLALKQTPTQRTTPTGRILYLVNNRSMVAGEASLEPYWLNEFWFGYPTAELVDRLGELLLRDDLSALAEERYERLKTRPMTAFLGPLVERLAETKG